MVKTRTFWLQYGVNIANSKWTKNQDSESFAEHHSSGLELAQDSALWCWGVPHGMRNTENFYCFQEESGEEWHGCLQQLSVDVIGTPEAPASTMSEHEHNEWKRHDCGR